MSKKYNIVVKYPLCRIFPETRSKMLKQLTAVNSIFIEQNSIHSDKLKGKFAFLLRSDRYNRFKNISFIKIQRFNFQLQFKFRLYIILNKI